MGMAMTATEYLASEAIARALSRMVGPFIALSVMTEKDGPERYAYQVHLLASLLARRGLPSVDGSAESYVHGSASVLILLYEQQQRRFWGPPLSLNGGCRADG